jgi:hypothetical protein
LEVLRLSDTQISEEGLTRLSGLHHLHELNLDRTRFTDRGLESQRALK